MVPIREAQRGDVGETAGRPFGASGTNEMGESALVIGIEKALRGAACEPDVRRQSILVCGQRGVCAIYFGEACGRAFSKGDCSLHRIGNDQQH